MIKGPFYFHSWSTRVHLRRPPPPPRAPPPLACPPLKLPAPGPPKLLFPRLLLARTELPPKPALPKAVAEPKFEETPRLAIRSPPAPVGRISARPPAPLEKPVPASARFIPALPAPIPPPLDERLIPAAAGWMPALTAYLFAVLLSA